MNVQLNAMHLRVEEPVNCDAEFQYQHELLISTNPLNLHQQIANEEREEQEGTKI